MLISFDTEHAPFTDYVKLQPLTCVSFAKEDGSSGVLHARDPRARALVADALTHHTSTGANIAHDMAEVCLEWPELIPLVWQAYADGRVRDLIQCERLITIADGGFVEAGAKNLDELAQKYGYGALDKSEDTRFSYGLLRDITDLSLWSEAQRLYPLHDAKAGLHIAHHQPRPVDWENASRADFCCELMGAWGFHTDLPRVARLKAHYRRQLETQLRLLTDGDVLRKLRKGEEHLDAELMRAALLRANTKQTSGYSKNMAAVKARMLASGATRPTKGGDICCDAEALEASGDPALMALAEYGSIVKRLGTDIPALERGELHCWFKPVMTNNQTSCSSPYNAQNPPTSGGERECVIPRSGNCFIDADYNLFQLRTLSQVCLEIVGRSEMADFLNQGRNLHSALSAMILNIPEAQFDKKKDREERGDRCIYDMAKRCNFGFGADMGYKRFKGTCSKQGVHVTEEEFWRYKNAWKRLFPEMPQYFNYIQSLGDGASITELFTGRVRGGCSYTDAANGYFSALAASAAKAAWFQIARECYDPSQGSVLFGSRPVNFVHDQFFVETPDDDGAHDRAMRVKEIMETATLPFLPDVPATTDPCLADRWSKKADAVFDKNKRLIVWSASEEEAA